MTGASLPERLTRAAALAVAAVMAAALFVGAEEAGRQSPFPGPFLDKVAHAGYFGIFATAVDRGLALRKVAPAVAIALAVGAADELHQRSVPGREADLLDWCADALGALGAASLRRRARKPGRP
jgi:VanZ family protein